MNEANSNDLYRVILTEDLRDKSKDHLDRFCNFKLKEKNKTKQNNCLNAQAFFNAQACLNAQYNI